MRTIEQMVKQEVSCCLSSLVATLANGDAHPGTDLAELCDRALGLAEPVPDYEEAAIQAGWSGYAGVWRHKDAHDVPTSDPLARAFSSVNELCDANGLEPIDSEVYEHWAVSGWLAEKLVALGEKVDTDFAAMNVWARQNTGQQISADDVIVRIYAKMMA